MKIFTIIFPLFFLVFSSLAQPSWTKVLDEEKYNKSTFKSSALFGDSIVLNAGYVDHGGLETPSYQLSSLIAYDLDGDILWHAEGLYEDYEEKGRPGLSSGKSPKPGIHKGPTYSPGGLFEFISADSEYLYAVGSYHDYYTSGFLAVSKLNENGDLVFHNKHYWEDYEYQYLEKTPVAMDVYQDGTFLIGLQDSTVVKTDSLGQIVTIGKYNFQAEQLGFIDPDNFFMLNPEYLLMADMQGNVNDSLLLDGDCRSILVYEDMIYQLYEDRLVTLDFDLNFIDTVYVSDGFSLTGIKLLQENLWLMGQNQQDLMLVKIENSAPSDSLMFDSYVESPDFLISGSQVIFSGTSFSEQMALYSYNLEEESQYTLPDIEVLGFDISVVEYDYIDGYPSPIGFTYNTEITVYNNSNDVVNSFAVYSHLGSGAYGTFPYFYSKFSEYTIPPYEELTITLPVMRKNLPPSNDVGFCFEIMAPNSALEAETDNNILCKSYDILNTENVSAGISLTLYPNPAKDHLYVKLGEEGPGLLTITDLKGSLIYEKPITDSEIILDVSGLKPGFYLLNITVGGKQFTRKIVKD